MTIRNDGERPDLAAGNARVIAEFRQHGGKVNGSSEGSNLLLLHTTGARTGRRRLTPLAYLTLGDRYCVMDGTWAYGATRKPDWYFNLLADRNVEIEVGAERFAAIARVLDGEERRHFWSRFDTPLPPRMAQWAAQSGYEFAIVELACHTEAPAPRQDAPPPGKRRRTNMNEELLAQIERDVLAWPGVSKVSMGGGQAQNGFWVPAATVFRFGRRDLGHIHVTGEADLPVPQKIYHELIATGRAQPHGAGFKGVVTYTIRTADDVPGAIELFRLNYERARTARDRTAA